MSVFSRIVRESIMKRKGKIAIAVVAVLMGASITSASIGVSLDVGEKVAYEFSKFGANIYLLPKSDTVNVGIGGIGFGAVVEQKYINESDLWKIKTISWQRNILGYAPFLYQLVALKTETQEQNVVLVGTWFEKEIILENGATFETGVKAISPWWSVEGGWIENQDDNMGSMIGVAVAEKLDLEVGDNFVVRYEDNTGTDDNTGTEIPLRVVGILHGGGSEDDQVFVNLRVAQELTNRPDKAHTAQVSALCIGCPVETIAAEIEEKIPYLQAKTVKQIAAAQMDLLGKIEMMMLLVAIVMLAAAALGVMTTMTTSVLERRKEIGLMKAIGAENRKIVLFFLSEATVVGIIGGILGCIVGFLLAQLIGISVFNLSIAPRLIVVPIAIGVSLGVSLLASILPVRGAVKVEPAVVLKGE